MFPILLLALLAALLLPACASPGTTPRPAANAPADDAPRSFEDEARAWLTDPANADGTLNAADLSKTSGTLPAGGNWTVLLAKISGLAPDQLTTALSNIRALVPDARIEERAAGTFIAVGSFASPTAPDAQQTLERVRAARIETDSGTAQPYRFAFLSPPDGSDLAGSMPEFDLRNTRPAGSTRRLFSLQIGIYGRIDNTPSTPEDIAQFRAAAELAVQRLRADGDPAYYFHSAQRSTVTLGVFADADFDARTKPARESPDLRELRKRFPYNLVNGATLMQAARDESGRRIQRAQPSFMILLPE